MKRWNTSEWKNHKLAQASRAAGLCAWLLTGLLAAATPAAASQIDVTNCQPQQVRICGLDPAGSDPITGAPRWFIAADHVLSQGDTKHFTCKANCKFWISEHCSDGKCSSCLGKGDFLDHSWGKGTYQLVALDRNHDGFYMSADLQKVDAAAACPASGQSVTAAPEQPR